MTLWRKARTEVAGAWRSVRYDLGRSEPEVSRAAGRPDVTSTGCHTFGGVDRDAGPRPRRVAAVSVFGVLVVAGAAGSYFAVVNGIGALAGHKPAGAEPYPLAAEGSRGDQSNSGLGRGTADARVPVVAATTAATTAAATDEPAPAPVRVLPAPTVAPVPPEVIVPRPQQTTADGPPDDCCLNPPVPTPTAPVVVPDSPSATPSPAASSPDGSASAEPSESPSSVAPSESVATPEPDEDEGHKRHPRRH